MKQSNILLVLISLILINSAVSAESQLPESSLYEQSCYEFEGQVLPRPKPCDYYQSAEEQVKEALIIASFEEYVENKEESLAKDYRATKLKLLNLAYEDLLSYLTVEQTQPPSRSDSCAERNINEGSRFQKIAERKKTGTSPSNEEIKKNKIKLVNDLIGSQRVLNRLETKIRELSRKQSEYNHDIRSGSCDITQTEGSSFLSGPDNLDRGIYSCKATRSGSQERCTSNCEELNSIEKSIRTLEKSRFEVLTNYPILSMSEWKSKLKSNSQLAMATSLSGEYDLSMTAEDADQILNDSLLRIQKNLLYTHSRVCNEGQNGIQDIIYNDKLIDELLKLHPEYARTYCESYREAERLKALKNYALAGASVVAVAGGITAPLVPAFAGSALAIGGAMTATDIAIAYSDVDSALKSESTLHSLVHGNESLENYRRVSEKNKQAILSGSMAALSSVGEVAGLVGSAVKTGARGAKAGVEGASETAELAGKIERVATRLEMNTDDYIKFVTKNANLSDAERKASILAKYPELAKDTNSVKMLDAVIEAHNHGKGSVFNYSPEVIAEKRAILKKAGWKDDQIQWMFDTGHAGKISDKIKGALAKIKGSFRSNPKNNDVTTKLRTKPIAHRMEMDIPRIGKLNRDGLIVVRGKDGRASLQKFVNFDEDKINTMNPIVIEGNATTLKKIDPNQIIGKLAGRNEAKAGDFVVSFDQSGKPRLSRVIKVDQDGFVLSYTDYPNAKSFTISGEHITRKPEDYIGEIEIREISIDQEIIIDSPAPRAPPRPQAPQKAQRVSAPDILGADNRVGLDRAMKSYGTANGSRVAASSDTGIGYGSINEDRVVVSPNADFIAVIDGMGGHGHGDVASQILSEEFMQQPRNIEDAVRNTGRRLKAFEEEHNIYGRKPGAVFASGRVRRTEGGARLLEVNSAGDASLIVVDRNGRIKFVSKQDGAVQMALRDGSITPDEALYYSERNVVYNNVDSSKETRIHTDEIPLSPGDRVIAMSDGIGDNLTPEEIIRLTRGKTPEEAITILAQVTDRRMTNIEDLLMSREERRRLGRYRDGFLSEPKRDNRAVAIMDIP